MMIFFCASDIVGENSETVTVAKGREVPVFGTVPGVFMRIPHPQTACSVIGTAPRASCDA